MADQNRSTAEMPAELQGEILPLMERLGLPDDLPSLSTITSGWHINAVSDFPTLRRFVERYQSEVLLRVELPAILRAYHHARNHEIRELIALDKQLGELMPKGDLTAASRRVGLNRLRGLRPLRDMRAVKRYLNAVETGEAQGWHTLVYGLTLAIYSLPLRQGLANYSRQTLSGFVNAAERSLLLERTECQELLDQLCACIPAGVESIIAPQAALRCVAC